jgi:hypothetical protein
MSYIDKNLMPGEEIYFRPGYHWVRFLPYSVVVLAGVALAVVTAYVAVEKPASTYLYSAAGFLAVAGLVFGGGRWFVDSFDEFALTSFRVVKKTGFVRREVRQIPLDKVQDLNLHATLWGRWLAYGDVELQTAGQDGTVVFPRIQYPEEFRNVLFAHLPRFASPGVAAGTPLLAPVPGTVPPPVPRPAPTVEGRLQELERLKQTGLVSEAEYQEKRKALLTEL